MCRALALLLVLAASAAADWPQWRGPTRNGLATEAAPTEWDGKTGIAFRTALPGVGGSSPVVVGGRVYLTASSGLNDRELHTLCHDAADGRLLWRRTLFGSPASLFTQFPPSRGHAIPTVAADAAADRLVALFGTGEVACFTLAGEPLWFRSLGADHGTFTNMYGVAASPLLTADRVFLDVADAGGSYLIALAAADGRTLWRTPRPAAADNWSSPILVPAAGADGELLLSTGTGTLTATDPTTGKAAWTVQGLSRLCCPTPLYRADRPGRVIVTSDPGGGAMSVSLAPEADGRVQWRTAKGAGFVPSGIVVGERYLYADDRAVLTCLDAATGEAQWQHRLAPGGGRLWAAPVAAGGLVYFTLLDGTVVVVRPGAAYDEVARNALGQQCLTAPAVAGGRLYFRGEQDLVCIDGASVSPPAAADPAAAARP